MIHYLLQTAGPLLPKWKNLMLSLLNEKWHKDGILLDFKKIHLPLPLDGEWPQAMFIQTLNHITTTT